MASNFAHFALRVTCAAQINRPRFERARVEGIRSRRRKGMGMGKWETPQNFHQRRFVGLCAVNWNAAKNFRHWH